MKWWKLTIFKSTTSTHSPNIKEREEHTTFTVSDLPFSTQQFGNHLC